VRFRRSCSHLASSRQALAFVVHVANSVATQQNWIRHLTGKFGNATAGGVRFFALDNEPGGWANTHRDVHPVAPTYQEIVQRSTQYARGIKDIDPTAWVAGPEDFGWAIYVGDPSKNGGLWNAIYYLQQMRAYEQANGVRILDYYTEHWYPSPPGVIDWSQEAGTPDVQAARLRSTRTFWDSTYREENWIGTYFPPGDAHSDVPQMGERQLSGDEGRSHGIQLGRSWS